MSTAVLTRTIRQDHVTASIDSFAAQQGAVTPSSQAILRLVSCYDSEHRHINENTISSVLGSHNGSLDIGCYNLSNGNLTYDVHATSLAADSEDAESAKTMICIHDWCVHQARSEHGYVPGQRFFRFEKGQYASSLPFPGLKVMQTAIKDFLSSVRGM